MNSIRIALSGTGGYAVQYLIPLLAPREGTRPFTFVAAADPVYERSPKYSELVERGIKLYHSYEEMLENEQVDLCIISSPIQFHLEQVRLAMEHGAHVLCEKPIAATLSQAEEMLALERQFGRKVMIGFQWSYAPGMLALKRDIMAGRYGKPVDLRVMVDWPRGSVYYARPWAAKLYDEAGRPVFDSIANNACAHYIHNMLFLLGDAIDTSVEPDSIRAQLYRAHDIQNFDTAFIEMRAKGAKLMFAASHSGENNANPVIDYRFEHARVFMTDPESMNCITVETDSGERIDYPMGEYIEKFYTALQWMDGGEVSCTVQTSTPHMKVIDALGRAPIYDISGEYITRKELKPNDFYNVAQGMDALLDAAMATGELPKVGDEPYIKPTIEL